MAVPSAAHGSGQITPGRNMSSESLAIYSEVGEETISFIFDYLVDLCTLNISSKGLTYSKGSVFAGLSQKHFILLKNKT